MKKPGNPLRAIQDVLDNVKHSEEAKHQQVESAGLSPQMARLREFQCNRIGQTYRDFVAQPQYAPVMDFFLSDLYGARDFTQRDHDATRAHNFLKKFVPAEMLKLATDAIELTEASNALDKTLLDVLIRELKFGETLTDSMYAEAYRRCNNYSEREYQIKLLVNVMRDAAKASQMLVASPALRMAKGPMYAAGWVELFDFLDRGRAAFSKVKKPDEFLKAIEERETKIMERIKQGQKKPFRT